MKQTTPYYRRLADCVGKEPFSTPQLARKVLIRRAKKPRYKGSKTRKVHAADAQAYHCQHCGLFHIGTRAKSVHAPSQRASHGDDEDMI